MVTLISIGLDFVDKKNDNDYGENYYYPLDVEQKLLDFIYYENFVTRRLNSCKSYDIIKELKSTIRKTLSGYKDSNDINNNLREVIFKNHYDINFTDYL